MRFLYAALVARFMHGWGRAFCFVLCYSALSANAQWLPGHDYVLDRAGNVIHVRGPSITTPSYVVTGSNTGAIVRSTKDLIVDNRKVAIQAVKTIPWKNVATGLKIVARTNPYAMAAGFAVDWLIDSNWKVVPCINNASMCDGLAQWQRKQTNTGGDITKDYQAATVPNAPWRASVSTVVNSDIKPYAQSQIIPSPGTPADQIPKLRDWRCSSSSCSAVQIDQRSDRDVAYGLPKWDPGSYSTWHLNERAKQIETGSESWVDSPPPDFDKEPPSAPDPGKAPDIWGDALPGGIPDSSGSPSVTGPSSSPGSSSTTTGPSGSITTTTVNNFTYQGDTITITQSTVTTTTSPTGETTTEETVSDKAPDKEEVDPCKQNPDSLGCIKLGEVPDEEVTKLTREVSVTAEAVNLPAQCPAPIEAAGYSLSFDAACDFSEGVHPFVLAAAALMAGLIVIRSIQGA